MKTLDEIKNEYVLESKREEKEKREFLDNCRKEIVDKELKTLESRLSDSIVHGKDLCTITDFDSDLFNYAYRVGNSSYDEKDKATYELLEAVKDANYDIVKLYVKVYHNGEEYRGFCNYCILLNNPCNATELYNGSYEVVVHQDNDLPWGLHWMKVAEEVQKHNINISLVHQFL